MSHRQNGLHVMRLSAALMVLVGHAFIYVGQQALFVGDIPLQTFGVVVFFVLSGYLVTQSWLSDDSLLRYFQRRALRIFPGLIVVAWSAALVVGPIFTQLPLWLYFGSWATYKYALYNSVMLTKWDLPGVFQGLPIYGIVNVSLWSLPVEFGLYCAVPSIVLLWRKSPRLIVASLVAAALALRLGLALGMSVFAYSFHGINIGWALAVIPFFLLGAALRLHDFGAWSGSARLIAVGVSLVITLGWLVAGSRLPLLGVVAALPLGILVLALGESRLLHAPAFERQGDFSYGVYLWSSMVQQAVIVLAGYSPWVNIALATPVTLLFATLSWHLVEKRPLAFKPKRRRHPEEQHDGPPRVNVTG